MFSGKPRSPSRFDIETAHTKVLFGGNGHKLDCSCHKHVLDATEGTPLLVEIKDRLAGPLVVETIQARGAERRVLVGSFESEPLVGVRAAGMSTTPSSGEARRFWIGSRFGWVGTGGRYDAFSLPERRGRLRVVDRRLVRVAARVGRPVHVWTVNDLETAHRLRSLGVAGIITNFPDRMRALG